MDLLSMIPGNALAGVLLNLMAASYNMRPGLRKYLKVRDGWLDFTIGVTTRDGKVSRGIRFRNGSVKALSRSPEDADTVMQFRDESAMKEMLTASTSEIMNLLLTNEMALTGNLATINKFNYLLALVMNSGAGKKKHADKPVGPKVASASATGPGANGHETLDRRRRATLRGVKSDAVKYLDDPFLPQYTMEDFPRLEKFLHIHLNRKPEICHERAKLLTDWFRENGFETDGRGEPLVPELRQARAYKYLMENRRPLIRKDDLLAGTTTTKEIGVVLYPDGAGTALWGELTTIPHRKIQPYDVSEETREILHFDVFPFWEKRNFREWVRKEYDAPLCQGLDERFAVYFLWKSVSLSHTVGDHPKALALGTSGIIDEINDELKKGCDADKENTLRAMILCLEGVNAYAENLSAHARSEAAAEMDPRRKKELEKLAEITARVPRQPARTLHEALNCVWIMWMALHMENTNAGLSIGRMDQWLQPFFVSDMAKIDNPQEREAYVKRAIELVGCFFLRCTDHLPTVPDIGNFLFGGSSSDQAITLGGVAPDGSSAVTDMTYIFLKVTELLSLRDPNMNARYNADVNSDMYLKRLCGVNLATAATPSMHSDSAVMASLAEFNYPAEDMNDWCAIGCVEPTISGKHIGHTNCMMMNMVAALEMAMHNGRHPLMDWEVGPKTGRIEDGAFETFEDFYVAFTEQFSFLIDQACRYNNMLGKAHGYIRPTPFLSSLIDGTITSGRDVTKGGARYNSSGAACIGLADVTDSLLAIKKLVYDEKKVTFGDMKRAVDSNYENDPKLHAMVVNRAPKFGGGDPEALEMATRVAKFTHDCYGAHENYRGGRYTAGFWSMSNHVAFGTLTGALPSGRLAGKPFTPGLTPQPIASDNLLDPIRHVAGLPPQYMNNNIAFNVKIVPAANDSEQQIVDNMFSYVKTFFALGGMQIQFNVITSDVLRDAMENPDNYRNLIVRISGYNAYFVTLNHDMQMELIERAEYSI